MRPVAIATIKLLCLALLVALGGATANGQDARVRLDVLDRLDSSAEQTVNINLDGQVLQLAWRFLSDKKPDEAKVKQAVSGIKGIYVKSFTFDKDAQYTTADIDLIRSQLRSPAWQRIVEVRSKKEGQNVDVYTMIDAGKINGLAIIATDKRTLTVVNMVGPVDIDKLSDLGGSFNIPEIVIGKTREKEK